MQINYDMIALWPNAQQMEKKRYLFRSVWMRRYARNFWPTVAKKFKFPKLMHNNEPSDSLLLLFFFILFLFVSFFVCVFVFREKKLNFIKLFLYKVQQFGWFGAKCSSVNLIDLTQIVCTY